MKRIVITFLLVSAAIAQTKKPKKPAPVEAAAHEDGSAWPLEHLKVEGNQNYTAEQVIAATRLKVGQSIDKAEMEAARQRLLDTGVFDRAGYKYLAAADGKGYDLTMEVAEMPQMYPVRFEDLPATDAQLRDFLKQKDPLFAPKIPATKNEIERYVKWIGEFLAQQNYHETLSGKVVSDNPGELAILFRPAKQRASVARVKFTNTGDLPSGLLQTAIYGVAVGTGYTEKNFRELLDASVRPLYEARGMIRVQFPKVETVPAKDVDGVEVTVSVEQGPVYKLGKVVFAGSDDLTPKELNKMTNLKPDKPVNFDDVRAGQDKIAQALRRDGYMLAKSEVHRKINDEAKTVDLRFEIIPGPQFIFHELAIVGLDIETEPVVRKLWGLRNGRPFNVDYPNHFLERVKEMGIFDNLNKTTAESKVNPKDNTVDVTLYFNK
ncbi:MAG TPA: POTRA domain-containing protein [Bryobacteraceae bacterium]|nr:POTRA domain-containing protein [Bryobacteraceae bacterium]